MTDPLGSPELDGPGELDLPSGVWVEPVTVDRLARQLASAPETVVGVVAAVADLPAGASTRTHAEWRSLLPLDETTDLDPGSPGGPPEGAVLRRRGRAIGEGALRLDPGSVVHHRSVTAAPDEDARPEGRSPFPWRPIVLFLALDDRTLADQAPDGQAANLVEALLEGLIDAEVEPRLAAPAATTTSRRHRPCAPTQTTVEALAPDVLVALDPPALEQGPAWCTRRGTVVIDMTGTAVGPPEVGPTGVEIVPWRIGTEPGRLRARVGRSVEPAVLARLVNRLAAGPQPVAPRISDPAPATDPSGPPAIPVEIPGEIPVDIPVDRGTRRAVSRRIGVIGPPGRPLLDSLADRASAAGHRVDRDPEAARDADVVLIAAEALTGTADGTTALLAERATAGRPSVAVVEDGGGLEPVDAADLPDGLVAVGTDARTVDALRRVGVPAQRAPTMTTTARLRALRAAADLPVTPSVDVIGWTILAPAGAPAPDDPAVAAALLALLDGHADLTVEIVADPGAVPEELHGRDDVAIDPGPADPGEQARRTVHVLTGPADASAARLSAILIESGHIGVPTLVGEATARAVGGLADARLAVPTSADGGPSTPDAWLARLRQLLDGPGSGSDRAGRSARARAASEALDSPATTDLVISRLLGWLDRRGRP